MDGPPSWLLLRRPCPGGQPPWAVSPRAPGSVGTRAGAQRASAQVRAAPKGPCCSVRTGPAHVLSADSLDGARRHPGVRPRSAERPSALPLPPPTRQPRLVIAESGPGLHCWPQGRARPLGCRTLRKPLGTRGTHLRSLCCHAGGRWHSATRETPRGLLEPREDRHGAALRATPHAGPPTPPHEHSP